MLWDAGPARTSVEEGLLVATVSTGAAHGFYAAVGFADVSHYEIDLRKEASEYSGFGLYWFFGMLREVPR